VKTAGVNPSRQRFAVPVLLLVVACGRTPTFDAPELLVQVVDEADDGVVAAEVELMTADDERRLLGRARTDGYGLATLDYPGNGTYLLHAQTDLRCCFRGGSIEVTLLDPSRIVVLETVTGPCPTSVPPGC
jgi:hypothetical protein